MQEKILILGIGNEILMDDGIGPYLAKKIGEAIPDERIHIESVCLGGLEILEYIKGYTRVYILDAIKTRDGKVGDVFFIKPSDFKETLHLSSLHDVGFLTALEVGHRLNMELPSEIRIAAVEIREDMEFGTQFSPELQGKIDEITEMVLSEISDWLKKLNIIS
jgi:hydrogenase maturation protease